MAVVFVLAGPGSGFSPLLGADAWLHDFDRVTDSSLETVIADYDVVISADELRQAPRLGREVRLAYLCTHFGALYQLIQLAGDADILFQPSLLACLDRYRMARVTLAAGRTLSAGQWLKTEDLATQIGGEGVVAGLKATVIGRRLLYDLSAGAAIDFGMIGKSKEDPR
jgi:hypothetical protein